MDKAVIEAETPPAASAGAGMAAPFEIDSPPDDAPQTALVFASPHSGDLYPPSMIEALRLDAGVLRNSEDTLVDALIAPSPSLGASVIRARYARAYIDLNRAPFELDQAMFEDELPDFARARTARVAAGLGTIARLAAGREIYRRKLTFAEAKGRIDAIHSPYHDALTRLLAQARAAHGAAVLIDWHSMPSEAAAGPARGGKRGPQNDIVLGDRFGAACAPALSNLAEQAFTAMGYRCARNAPYAGGYTTEHYGRPARRTHALQIEINRALYLDETSRLRTAGFAQLSRDIAAFTAKLANMDLSLLQ